MKGVEETKPTLKAQPISNVPRTASAVVRALSISARGIMKANVYFALVNVWKKKNILNSEWDIGCIM